MNILVIADLDDFRWKYSGGQADVVAGCGDVVDPVLIEAAHAYGCGKICAVKGNHDANAPFAGPIQDLHLKTEIVAGVTFGGFQGSWRYKPRGNFLYDQDEAEALLAGFPAVDVFVSHNSPLGIHDKDDEVHYGFQALTDYIERAQPKLVIHGHQHMNRETVIGATRVIGVYGWRVITYPPA